MARGLIRGTRPRESDDAAARLVARLRLVVLTIAALGAGIAFGEGSHAGLQYTLAFFGVPAAVAVALAVDRLPATFAAIVGSVIDIVVFGVTIVEFPDAVGTLAALFLVPVLVSSYTGGRLLGAVTGVAGVALIGTADLAGWVAPSADVVPLIAIAIAVCLAVVGRADTRLLISTSRARYHEARSSLILERLAEAVVVTGPAGRVTQYNAAAEELLAVGSGAPTCGAVLGLEVEGRPVDCSAGCGLLAIEGSRESGGIEASACARGARRVPVMVSVSEIPGADGETVEHLHTLRDVTKLKQADEAKTLFLATATHELKTPLTVIKGFLQTLDNPRVDDELRATAIGVMRHRAEELNAIIERLLLASRIESGLLTLELGPTDAAHVARDRVAGLATATGRTISLSAPSSLPLSLGDERALATVLDHLLDNACKYSPPETPIGVSVAADDNDVIVAVRDAGVGMTAVEAAHCFDRFWQADSTSRRQAGGTGIGLYIVRSLVMSMQGSISVASAPGEGTAFTVRLGRTDVPTPLNGLPRVAAVAPEPSIVREFMRQIGVDTGVDTKESTR